MDFAEVIKSYRSNDGHFIGPLIALSTDNYVNAFNMETSSGFESVILSHNRSMFYAMDTVCVVEHLEMEEDVFVIKTSEEHVTPSIVRDILFREDLEASLK